MFSSELSKIEMGELFNEETDTMSVGLTKVYKCPAFSKMMQKPLIYFYHKGFLD